MTMLPHELLSNGTLFSTAAGYKTIALPKPNVLTALR